MFNFQMYTKIFKRINFIDLTNKISRKQERRESIEYSIYRLFVSIDYTSILHIDRVS